MRLQSTRKLTYNWKRGLQLLFKVLPRTKELQRVVELMELRRRTLISARSLNARLKELANHFNEFALEDGQLINALQNIADDSLEKLCQSIGLVVSNVALWRRGWIGKVCWGGRIPKWIRLRLKIV